MNYKSKIIGGVMMMASLILASCASDDNDSNTKPNPDETIITELSDSVCDALGQSSIEEFLAFAKNPRCSFYSTKSSAYLIEWAQKHNLEYGVDDSLNVWIDVPANAASMESLPKVILQAHQDMVCDSKPGETYDYRQVVGEPYYDGTKLKGKKLNLGADDGIGVGMALAIAKSNVAHGPLRLLFTTNEDCGLYGVKALSPTVIDADYLISFDDEDYAKLTTGCLGGYANDMKKTYAVSQAAAGSKEVALEVAGLLGGHSGTMIGKHRLSGATVLAKVVKDVVTPNEGRLVAIDCGFASNAIANKLKMSFVVDAGKADACKAAIEKILADFRAEYPEESFTQACTVADVPAADVANVSPEQTLADINKYFAERTQGVVEREGTDGIVTKSNNIGVVTLDKGSLVITSLLRSFSNDWISSETTSIATLASDLGMSIDNEITLPAWDTPDDDPFLGYVYDIYKELEPKVYKRKAEGGLECAYFLQKKPTLKTIALGPDINGAHTSDEYVDTATMKPLMKVVMTVLQKIGSCGK